MPNIDRKYDFVPGQRVYSAQIDEELNQLVDAHNTNDNSLTTLTNRVATNETTLISTQSALTGKTDREGDHLGTWQGLTPTDLDSGNQALDLLGKQDKAEKGLPNGYAGLDDTGNVPVAQLGNVSTNPIETLMYWII